VTGCCEHGDEPPGCIRGGEFLDYLSNCWLLKDFSPSIYFEGDTLHQVRLSTQLVVVKILTVKQ
jgi:hypothetical protein